MEFWKNLLGALGLIGLGLCPSLQGETVDLPAPTTVQTRDFETLLTENRELRALAKTQTNRINQLLQEVEAGQIKLSQAVREQMALRTEIAALTDALTKLRVESYDRQEVDKRRLELETRLAQIEQGLLKENEDLRRRIKELTKDETPFPKK